MIHVYVGDGKEKTTVSVGLSVRSAGHGFKVLFIQFLKDESSGEVTILRTIPGIEIIHAMNAGMVEREKFSWQYEQ